MTKWISVGTPPTEADADSNGDVVWLRSHVWDCLGKVSKGIPADATDWKHSVIFLQRTMHNTQWGKVSTEKLEKIYQILQSKE
jgi:hypothetical protein